MRIALYEPDDPAPDPFPFGESRVTPLTRQALTACGHEVEAISGTDAAPLAAWRADPQRRPQLWISARVSARGADAIGPAVSAEFGIPYVLLHPSLRRGGDAYMDGLLARAAAVIVLSSAAAQALPGSGSPPSFVLPPFVDLGWINTAHRNRAHARRLLSIKLRLQEARPWLIAAGPMSADGDMASWRMVAHAMSALAWMNWHLIVAGAGPRRQEVEALFCAVPGRPDRHVPVATDGDLIDLLAASDLFIWPSLDEEFSLVAVEAQAAGIGIVAGKSPAMADVVANGRTGMLVKLDNEASFANGVSFLLRHPEFRRTYAQEGPRWAVMNFDLAVVATQLDAALHRIVRAAGGEDAAPSLRPVG